METVDQNENPYVAIVSRKSRNLKKKLERVIKVESQLKEGKKLNEEQLVLVASKASLEKALSDVESIKTQLEEVAKQELLLKQQQEQQQQKQKQKQQKQKQQQKAETQENKQQTETVVVTEKTDSSTATNEVQLTTNSTQSEQQEVNVAPVSNPTNNVVDFSEVLRGHLIKLLKLFHVCSRYSTLSGGNVLPPDINYFGKCLLGETTVDSFTKALNQSVRNAELYLDEDLGSQYEAIRGMSYSQISDIIDSLVLQLPQPESSVPHVPTPPTQSPQINFFADGDINEESFNPSTTSPFPLPPSAVMYDQWSNDQNSSSVSAVNGSNVEPKVESTSSSNHNQNSEVVEDSSSKKEEENVNNNSNTTTDATPTENRESGGRRGRGYSRGRGSKGRGRGGRTSSKENNTQSQSNEGGESQHETKESNENKKGVSWGGQQKKAGGALATVSGTPEATTTSTTTGSSSTPGTQEKEGGRGGRGRGRGRSGGRGGRGPKEFESSNNNTNNNNNSTEGTSTTKRTSYSKTTHNTTTTEGNTTSNSTSNGNFTGTGDKGRGSGGRGNYRGRGRGFSRGEGRGGSGGRFQSREKPAVQPSST
mmetsp:Transcript_14422/g.15090  ORF Transcript_14422/g.15090 Transcript_14422/m.15090 type:complete len:592 (+) Transcript_14422:65-1840(+)